MSSFHDKKLPNGLRQDNTALLVIDMQNDFVNEGGYFAGVGQNLSIVRKTIPSIKEAIDFFRENGMLVIFTQTLHYRFTNSRNWLNREVVDSPDPKICIPGTWGAEIIKELEPEDGEPIVIKHRFDAFLNTDLDLIFRARGIKNIVMVGTQTNICVDSTARRAYMMDYVTILLEEGVSTPKMHYQQPILENFHENFGYVMNWDRIKSNVVREGFQTAQ